MTGTLMLINESVHEILVLIIYASRKGLDETAQSLHAGAKFYASSPTRQLYKQV